MAGAPNYDDTGSHGMTPPRRLQPEDGGEYGQPAEGGGSLAINYANEVARALRNEMLELRSAIMANLDATKRDIDAKMSGRVGSEHHEVGTLKTLNDKIDKLEKENKDIKKDYEWLLAELETATPRITKLEEDTYDIQMNMKDVKDIVEIVKDDENITGMITKYEELVIDGEALTKTKNMMKNIEAKLKEDFDKDIEDMNARIDEIKKNIDERDGMPSTTPILATSEDKLEKPHRREGQGQAPRHVE